MKLLIIAVAPAFIIAFYIYIRDKYEKEPIIILLKSIILGAFIVLPVLIIEKFISTIGQDLTGYFKAGWNAFLVAGFTEELFKYLAFIFLIWKNPNFNEKFDGIVYAVFISMGFAAVENIMYVMTGGIQVGLTRALTAVPAHALFGISMGYYLGLAKFYVSFKRMYLILAFLTPFFLHGLYDFILMAGNKYLLVIFIPYLIFISWRGFRKIDFLQANSIFRM